MNGYLQIVFLLLLSVKLVAQKTILTILEKPKNNVSVKLIRTPFSIELYDSNNLLIEKKMIPAKDTVSFDKTVFRYNKNKQLEQLTEYYGSGENFTRKNYIYNTKGQLETIWYKQRNKMGDSGTVTETFTYDDSGRLIKKKTDSGYPGGLLFFEYRYTLNDGIKTVTEQWYRNRERKKKKNRKITVYNQFGLPVSVSRKNEGYWFYSYTFDSEGNWITKKECYKYLKLHNWNCITWIREFSMGRTAY